jgi:hypothetical protein
VLKSLSGDAAWYCKCSVHCCENEVYFHAYYIMCCEPCDRAARVAAAGGGGGVPWWMARNGNRRHSPLFLYFLSFILYCYMHVCISRKWFLVRGHTCKKGRCITSGFSSLNRFCESQNSEAVSCLRYKSCINETCLIRTLSLATVARLSH